MAHLGLLWVPLSFALLIALPALMAPEAGSLNGAIERCDEYRNLFILARDDMKWVTIHELPADLSTGYTLERKGEFGWPFVATRDAKEWEHAGLTSDWVLALFYDGLISDGSDWSQVVGSDLNTLPQTPFRLCNQCSFHQVKELGPDGIIQYMNSTFREHLPATALFTRPPSGGKKNAHTQYQSFYNVNVCALASTTLGALIANIAQVRGRIKTKMQRAVIWYFFAEWLANGIGGIGYAGISCMYYSERSERIKGLLFIMYVAVGFPAMWVSNVYLQWILVYKMEAVNASNPVLRRLRAALRGEEIALCILALGAALWISFLISGQSWQLLQGTMILCFVICAMITIADVVFSYFAVKAYWDPLKEVGKSLEELKYKKKMDKSVMSCGDQELKSLRKAYRVTLLNLAATILAVCSTTMSYAVSMYWFYGMSIGRLDLFLNDWGLRIPFMDSIFNDVCTIIFADLLYINLSKDGGTEQGTLFAIAQVGVHAALRQQRHEEEQQELTEGLQALAKGPNPKVHQCMADLEISLRVASLDVFSRDETAHVEELFRNMHEYAVQELRRLEELMLRVVNLYSRASTRFEYLLAAQSHAASGDEVRQKLPAEMRLRSNESDNGFAMRYLYRKADVIAPEFNRRLSALVEAFNSAENPEDLGLDPAQYPFSIFAVRGASAVQTWGPQKTEARAWQKVQSDYANRPSPQVTCLLDIERMLVTFPDPYALAIFFAFLVQEGSLPVVRVKNRFLEKKDLQDIEPQANEVIEYKDVLINVNVQDHIVEIQLALANLAELKSCMHPFYKVARASNFEDVASQAIFAPPHKISEPAPGRKDLSGPNVPVEAPSLPSSRRGSSKSIVRTEQCSTTDGTSKEASEDSIPNSTFDQVIPGFIGVPDEP